MVTVTKLGVDEHPSSNKFALVDLDQMRPDMMLDMMLHGSGATFYVPPPHGDSEWAGTIERAKEWAEKNAVPIVYVAAH